MKSYLDSYLNFVLIIDYPGFITKAMKLLQLSKYILLRKVCVELTKMQPSDIESDNRKLPAVFLLCIALNMFYLYSVSP